MQIHRHEDRSSAPGTSGAATAPGEAYAEALAAAQPDPRRVVVRVDLEAQEFDWEFVPATRTRAWGFGGPVPGPTIEAQVGDVLEIRFTTMDGRLWL